MPVFIKDIFMPVQRTCRGSPSWGLFMYLTAKTSVSMSGMLNRGRPPGIAG
ncbi:hypothetical protein CISG_01853 [Coccidioides immitis RMSCC 3703]|uniref:Uncharacterized protein n=2 Tax=Coccidioides immitis TaxID=5501 RepID=A0A0J8R531_COCIT|nr:hypothetical protein CIRG_08495 [Coccidioides immitis RMSCC 2394]KMU78813.1 hypothetical protein CISG_01853 [Coccidioides immitis RMSCC 3703]